MQLSYLVSQVSVCPIRFQKYKTKHQSHLIHTIGADLNLENQQVIADQELELRNLREALLKYRKNQAAQEAGLESINKFKDEAEVRGDLTC
jgi:hypothetical protein